MEEVLKTVPSCTFKAIVDAQAFATKPKRTPVRNPDLSVSEMGRTEPEGAFLFPALDGNDLGFLTQAEQRVALRWQGILFSSIHHENVVRCCAPEAITRFGIARIAKSTGITQQFLSPNSQDDT